MIWPLWIISLWSLWTNTRDFVQFGSPDVSCTACSPYNCCLVQNYIHSSLLCDHMCCCAEIFNSSLQLLHYSLWSSHGECSHILDTLTSHLYCSGHFFHILLFLSPWPLIFARHLDWHTHPQSLTGREGLSSTISLAELSLCSDLLLASLPQARPWSPPPWPSDSRNMAMITANHQ